MRPRHLHSCCLTCRASIHCSPRWRCVGCGGVPPQGLPYARRISTRSPLACGGASFNLLAQRSHLRHDRVERDPVPTQRLGCGLGNHMHQPSELQHRGHLVCGQIVLALRSFRTPSVLRALGWYSSDAMTLWGCERGRRATTRAYAATISAAASLSLHLTSQSPRADQREAQRQTTLGLGHAPLHLFLMLQ
jgi:hypothetical protein